MASGKPWVCVKNRREAVFPKVDTPYGQALTGLRVQAPLGARVLSFVCCAPNDGFSPQSGLVQRGILYAAWRQRKPYNRPGGGGNAFPLWWLTPPPCPVGSMSLDSRVAGLPYESSSFATPASGGRITRAYCRAAYEENDSRCFILPPCIGGSPAQPERGWRAQRANPQNAYHNV